MSKTFSKESHYILQVKALLAKVKSVTPLKDSVVERACAFYENKSTIEHIKDNFNEELEGLHKKLAISDLRSSKVIEKTIARIQREQRDYIAKIAEEKNVRNKHLLDICHEIVALSEADCFDETNRKSAKLLGTIQLLSPTEGKTIRAVNERHKPIYKAVLALRLLDRLCADNHISDPYIKEYLANIKAENFVDFSLISPKKYQSFVSEVKVPLVMAALLQDMGHYHFETQKIMWGEDGKKDPQRTLAIEDRKKILQIDYRETLTYLIEGIGMRKYIGNSKVERDKFNQQERKRFTFITKLLKNSAKPKESAANLLTVPKIYASIILSTKKNYNYKLLPKVYNALNKNASHGYCSQIAVDALRKVTGDFPQGYGVTYIPSDSSGKPCDRYEYAIVNALYPENPSAPICRSATRNLTFISYGTDHVVNTQGNLYFIEVVKKLSRVSKERLNEILELLSSNYLERKQLDLLPRCWQTPEFFSIKKNQNIWNRPQG